MASNNDVCLYKHKLDKMLNNITVPADCIICTNVLCTNNSHIDSIQKLNNDIISSIRASDCIPNTGQSKRKIPGWGITVSHARKIALFWRSIWINLNSPRTHIMVDIMRRTRATYHYKIRKLKKDREKPQKKAMAKAISENNSRQLWTEVRKIRNKNSSSINCIDDITGNSCIAELFSKKYDELYNSVLYQVQEMNDLMSVNKKDVKIFCVNKNTHIRLALLKCRRQYRN